MGGRKIALLLMVSLLAVAATGCGGDTATQDPEAGKLLVIGIDSADWSLLRPMVEEGRLPHLQRFMAESAHGRMKTFYPLEKSPLLWASITTGVRPEVHGVAHFVEGRDQKPATGSAWWAPALWDILGAAGRTTAVMGMWNTYPARDIAGVMVSDYLPYGHERETPLAGLVAPDSLTEAVLARRVSSDDLTHDQLARFFDAGADLAALEVAWPDHFAKLRAILAADMTYFEVARLLAHERDDDLFFFYLRGPDMMSHYFFHLLKPENVKAPVDPQELEIFGGIVPRYYEWCDEVMGEVLAWFPPTRQAVVLSDHGFYGPRKSGGKGTAEHSEWGVFLVRSPLYRAGAAFGHLELLDICPTMLALMGLPPAADMPGRILAEALTDDGDKRLSRMENGRVASYQGLRPADGPQGERDPAVDEEIRKQLRSLGYIK